jgi:hypothetical protein
MRAFQVIKGKDKECAVQNRATPSRSATLNPKPAKGPH